MIFNYITFRNYRPYYGTQTLILHKEQDKFSPHKKNITLIGGLNGAGKTSLINAFFICLYGRRKFKKDEYEQIKFGAINKRHLREGGKESYIRLGFTDRTGTYVIEVAFKYDFMKNDIEEFRKIFIVQGDQERQIASSEEEFNEFIDQRIPIDVAPFFIFDAEKIRDLVGEQDKQETIDAIQKVVSLELYKQLQVDLEKIVNQDSQMLAKVVKDDEIQKLNKELDKVTKELEILRAEGKPIDAKIEYLNEEKKALEHKRRLKLSNTSETKSQLNRRIGVLETELDKIQKTFQSFSKSLPKLILSPLVRELQNKIRNEQEYIRNASRIQMQFAPYDKFINHILKVELQPPLTEQQKNQLIEKGRHAWAHLNNIQQKKVEPMDILHSNDLSHNELQSILNWSVSNTVDIRALNDQKIKFQNELNELNKKLQDAPDAVNTKEEDEKINSISEELGALNLTRKQRIEKLSRLTDLHSRLSRERTAKLSAKKDLGPIEQKLNLMTRLSEATREFLTSVTVLKAQQLKSEIEAIMLTLFRKNDLQRVEFNPKEFTLRIFNEFNEEIDLNSRSEGEKQLIALSMIWALTKVSGTNFPFVIDTPLARLDSIHRNNIVNHYFINLSDQVIILTTDTEITKEFVDDIEPYVQSSYILDYNETENYTTVSEGYFQFN